MNMKRSIVVIMVALAGMCFAPIEDKPAGKEFHGELSDRQMSQYQGGSSQITTPSEVKTLAPESEVSQPRTSAKAANILAKGSLEKANESLVQAEVDQKNPSKERGSSMMLAGLLVMIGLATAYGIRMYMDRSIPDVSDKKGRLF